MAIYKLIRNDNGVIRRSDNAYIPNDTRNPDWRDYLTWVAAGNTVDAADPLSQAEQNAATELSGQSSLSNTVKANAVFNTLRTATEAQISTYVDNNFSTFTAQQKMVIRTLLDVAALALRKGIV